MPGSLVTVEVDPLSLAKAREHLGLWFGTPLDNALKGALWRASQVLRAAIIAETPNHDVQLVKSTRVRRTPDGRGYTIGPRGKKAHLIIGGSRGHEIDPRRKKAMGGARMRHPVRGPVQHPGSRANPYVARAGFQARGAASQVAFTYLVRRAASNPKRLLSL